jgi:hypothetical protein
MPAQRAVLHILGAVLLLLLPAPRVHAELRLADVHLVVGHHGSVLFFRREGFDVEEGVLITDPEAKRLRFEAKGRSLFDVSFDRFAALRYEESGPRPYLIVHHRGDTGAPDVAILRLPSSGEQASARELLAALERDSGVRIERGPAATSFVGLPVHLRVGKKVRVTDRAGAIVTGRVAQRELSSIDLGPAGRFDAAAVERIDVIDPLWNGAIVGYFLGGVVGSFVVFATCFECSFKEQDIIAYSFMAAGAGVGVGVDGKRMRNVYRRLNLPGSAHVEWQPVIGKSRQGLQVSFRF